MISELILQNKELIKILYGLALIFICEMVVLKTDRIFKISDYQGLRYLRNSFFFYGLSFIVLFILVKVPVSFEIEYSLITQFLFLFFNMVAGLFLFYSLTWKLFEKKKSHNSLLNLQSNIIYLISFFIAFSCLIFEREYIFIITQIILFSIIFILSLKKVIISKTKIQFTKYYFIAVFFNLLYWIFYFFNALYGLELLGDIFTYVLTAMFYIIFLIGILNSSSKKNG